MIIPVIFSLSPTFDNLMYSWVFYKGISLAKNYGWPVFAQRQYFEAKERQKQLGFLTEAFAKGNDYDLYSPADESCYIRVEFPEERIQRYIAKYPSQTDAYLASMAEPWPEMTTFMVETVRTIEKQLGEKADAFMCLHDTPFIRDAARQLGIDIIHFEWGPFRATTYRNTAYLDLKGSVCDGEMLERYEKFKLIQSEVPLLGSKEILSLFLKDEYLDYAVAEDEEPIYEAGLALGYNVIHNFASLTQSSAIEALSAVHKEVGTEKIWVRYHPGDPIHAKLAGIEEHQGPLIDFIKKSKRIVCINSNVAFEAMLFHRPAYDLGMSKYGVIGNHSLKGLTDNLPEDDFLSFIAFGYLIPFELLKNVEYLRWRLSRPGEKEIYLYHLSYYLNCYGLEEELLSLPANTWFERIMTQRGQCVDLVSTHSIVWAKLDERARLYIEIEQYKKTVDALHEQKRLTEQCLQAALSEKNSTEQHLQAALSEKNSTEQRLQAALSELQALYENTAHENALIKNSQWWKITKPGRALFSMLKRTKILSNLIKMIKE